MFYSPVNQGRFSSAPTMPRGPTSGGPTMRKLLMLAGLAALLTGCGDPPIRKTNCWSGMAFVATSPCD
ncbi:hypothetical protein GCM10011402_38150 [Paracoccus acridae]|uniref:Uncharacterized protein n=1 Tax=Paracoccus acridae TaxID=1795310 RepID=A0ABQ1VMV3_9RHOB|nr:hypothetical protein GCM10011402_38150 [Paracoccus acridae]